MNQQLSALFGLKWHPFSSEVPTAALQLNPRAENFCWRIEHSLTREGGFAMIHGEPGTGKSVVMRQLAERLARQPELTVGVINHPQSSLGDFYREMGEVFGVPLRPHNRWGGFKALRESWQTHMETTLHRPVLLIDEAQEMSPAVLSELRLMASARFDSRSLLCVVLAGDSRLPEKLRREELIPLGTRIRTRLVTEPAQRDELVVSLKHLISEAGNASLISPPLIQTLCDQALGNYRVLMTMGAELLAVAVQRQLAQIDEKLYLEICAQTQSTSSRRIAPSRR